MRKLDNPIITGYEFHILNLVSYACPKALILPYLRETLAELKSASRTPRARTVPALPSSAARSTIPA